MVKEVKRGVTTKYRNPVNRKTLWKELVILDIVSVISQVGFPIAVAVYSLVVLNKTVQRNTDVMTRIAAKLDIPCEEVDETKKGG